MVLPVLDTEACAVAARLQLTIVGGGAVVLVAEHFNLLTWTATLPRGAGAGGRADGTRGVRLLRAGDLVGGRGGAAGRCRRVAAPWPGVGGAVSGHRVGPGLLFLPPGPGRHRSRQLPAVPSARPARFRGAPRGAGARGVRRGCRIGSLPRRRFLPIALERCVVGAGD